MKYINPKMNSKKTLFGTDGIRGKANVFPIDPHSVLKISMILAQKFQNPKYQSRVIIGKDTRLSGYMIENAMTAGFVSMGIDVILVGPLPSPAISMLIRSFRADFGVMISASHNSHEDNGIKVFGPDCRKLSNDQQDEIEKEFYSGKTIKPVSSEAMGKARRYLDAPGRYIEYLKNTLPVGTSFEGLKVVVDCANGAGYRIAPQVLFELGAEVITIGDKPDGTNINFNCGATNTGMIANKVIETNADIGFALDGDADRLQVIDHRGNHISGEDIIALIATQWNEANRLAKNTVVSTISANISLSHFLNSKGINLKSTPVGDRYITDAMRKNGFNFGGEPSGHILMGDFSDSGDGILTSLQLLSVLQEKQKSIGDICPLFEPVPQKQFNIPMINSDPMSKPEVKDSISRMSDDISSQHGGRLIVRKSGTEPVIRVTIEVENESIAEEFANSVKSTLIA